MKKFIKSRVILLIKQKRSFKQTIIIYGIKPNSWPSANSLKRELRIVINPNDILYKFGLEYLTTAKSSLNIEELTVTSFNSKHHIQ